MNSIEEKKTLLLNNLSNKDFIESNKVTNSASIEFFSSYLDNLVNDLVYTPLREAMSSFIFLEMKEKGVELNGEILKMKDEYGNTIQILKKSNLFWFFVFSYMFRSSQVIGFMQQNKLSQRFPDLKELRKLIASEYIRLKKSENKSEGEKNNEQEEQEVKLKPFHKEVKSKETLTFFPSINGAEERSTDESEEEDFEENEEEEEEDETF